MKLISYFKETDVDNLLTFTTLRNGGVSLSSYDSLNLGGNVEDDIVHVTQNRNILASQLGVNVNQMVFPNQTHSDHIRIVGKNKLSEDELQDVDALITKERLVCLCILTADCVPILVYDPVKEVIAAIHSGWRGTVKNIAGKTIQEMVIHFGSNPKDLMIAMGPCISQKVYEVGDEVMQAFQPLQLSDPSVFVPSESPGKYYLDLIKANKELLIRSGVNESQIETEETCTYINGDLFFSARRDGHYTGRMATGIMMK